jgi:hypothetical protein
LNDEWLIAAAERSMAEVLREEARHASGGTVLEEDGLLLCRGPGQLPTNPNAAMRVAPGADARSVLDRADAFYAARGAGYCLHFRLGDADGDLATAASERRPLHEGDVPAMVVGGPLEPPALDPAVELRLVDGAEGIAAYAAVVDEAYQSLGWPAGAPSQVFTSPALLVQPSKAAFVAWVGGTPVATAYVAVTDGLGLISWVGTTSAARGRGLATAVTVAATNAGFELGARAVWLMASTMGEPTYRRLGFREFCRSRSVILWPRAEDPAP